MTCKEEGLWDPMGIVTREDIKHMKARVEIFRATHLVGDNPDLFDTSPACAEPWCRWILLDSLAYAARQGPNVVKRAKREPLALPPLPEHATAVSRPTARLLTEGEEQRIQTNRGKALQKKQDRQKKVVEAEPSEEIDDEDFDYNPWE